MKIWNLIRKDILFCQGWIFAGMILAAAAPVYILCFFELEPVFEEPAILLSALLACNVVTSRICYVEDNYETKNFLSALPVFGYQFVLARYIEGIVTGVVMTAITIGVSGVWGLDPHFEVILMAVFLELIYESIYLFLFYRWGSNIAQYALISMVGMFGVGCFILDKYNMTFETMYFGTSSGIALALSGILAYLLSAALSCKRST